MLSIYIAILAAYPSTTSATSAFRATNQFIDWYPEFGFVFSRILRENCTRQYDRYLHGQRVPHPIEAPTGADNTNQLAQPVVDCILSSTSEFIKANMSSAQVVLGLTPLMLATLGPSIEETTVLFGVGRRPFLALAVAASSPAVNPMRAFENVDPIRLLKEREGRVQPPKCMVRHFRVVMLFEYILLGAAIANVATVSRELGIQAVSSYAPHVTYLELLWAFLIIIVHMSAAIAFSLRVRFKATKQPHAVSPHKWLTLHFTSFEDQRPFKVTVLPETFAYQFFSWFTAMLTICHVLFATVTLSSLFFISARDSIAVIGRYFASVICCRLVLMYELACLRNAYNDSSVGGSDKSDVELSSQPGGSHQHRLGQSSTW